MANGNLPQADFFTNQGGLNVTDSPFTISDGQSTGGGNYEYGQTGAISKRNGHRKLNSTSFTAQYTTGINTYNPASGTKVTLRAADRKLQALNSALTSATDLTEDTSTAGSDLFPASNETPTVFSQFNTASVSVAWLAGNTSGVYGAYSTTKYTKNGSTPPAGSISAVTTSVGGSFVTSGTFRYAVSFTKAATLAESNVSLDIVATITATTDLITLSFASISNVDSTKYSKLNLYRSSVGGSEGFTTGDLVASLTLPVTSYQDTGSSTLSSQNIPRAGSTVLDNSELPAGTYNILCSFKRRLVAVKENVVYISDINKPESWPTVNVITVPSGGPVTACGVAAFSTNFDTDEYLTLFKERELWVITGSSYTDYQLKFVDSTGCSSQPLLVNANGYLTWIDYRGVYLWDGSGKPIYTSRPIETVFQSDGDLDKTKLHLGVGQFLRRKNMVIWALSHKIYGEQKYFLKLDLRLTLPKVETTITGRVLDGVFVQDSIASTGFPTYAMHSVVPNNNADERLYLGDASGYVYAALENYSDGAAEVSVPSTGGSAIDFQYYTKFLDMGNPNIRKRFHSVYVWVNEVGSWDLTLDYWSGYRAELSDRSTLSQPLTTATGSSAALWDVAYWDQANWDDYNVRGKLLKFNLSSNSSNNAEGDCIRLRFSNNASDEPLVINGFSILWSPMGGN